MPTDSPWPIVDIPNIGIWDLIFENKNRAWPDDQGELFPFFVVINAECRITLFNLHIGLRIGDE
jgi:hypothetical protein